MTVLLGCESFPFRVASIPMRNSVPVEAGHMAMIYGAHILP
jgi:hypothetical protein